MIVIIDPQDTKALSWSRQKKPSIQATQYPIELCYAATQILGAWILIFPLCVLVP